MSEGLKCHVCGADQSKYGKPFNATTLKSHLAKAHGEKKSVVNEGIALPEPEPSSGEEDHVTTSPRSEKPTLSYCPRCGLHLIDMLRYLSKKRGF